jgi:hypothetical protein
MARVRSSFFQLVIAPVSCWSCRRPTLVGALVATMGSELWDDDSEVPTWKRMEESTTLSNVTTVSTALGVGVQRALPAFRLDRGNTVGEHYWVNHCSNCDVRISDWRVHSAPSGPRLAWPVRQTHVEHRTLGDGEVSCELPDSAVMKSLTVPVFGVATTREDGTAK